MKKIIFLVLVGLSSFVHADFSFPDEFEFGVANAPVHVEDNNDDIWLDWAKQGKVRSYHNQYEPDLRLEFWSKPEIEIELAKNLGVKVFRIGVDWQRLFPEDPRKINSWKVQNQNALKQYKEICRKIKASGMKVMLTLFHHSEPKWTMKRGGWTNPSMIEEFRYFSQSVYEFLKDDVDYWLTFNEPNVYILFSRVVGNWPPGQFNPFALLNIFGDGELLIALKNMAKAHQEFFDYVKLFNKGTKISVAHNMANYRSGGIGGELISNWLWESLNYKFLDLVKQKLDFLGFNYYGAEYVSLFGLHFNDRAEYNDAGRAIDVNGFDKVIKKLYERYQLPLYITENGTADAGDIIRPLYLLEHLKVISKNLDKGIPIMGYIHWSLTDNFEWSDGYCPKFGLVAVDRKNDLKRVPRKSYKVYQNLIKYRSVKDSYLKQIATEYRFKQGVKREMCRAENASDALDEPRLIPLKNLDWRGSY